MPEKPLAGRSELALEIRRLRRRAAMSQDDLADAMNSTQQVIIRWELDKNIPSIQLLTRLATALKVDVKPLLELRYKQCKCRTGVYVERRLSVAPLNYLQRDPQVDAATEVYRIWSKGRAGLLSFRAGWNAACASDVNFQFNG